jgi:hypothetical protein
MEGGWCHGSKLATHVELEAALQKGNYMNIVNGPQHGRRPVAVAPIDDRKLWF